MLKCAKLAAKSKRSTKRAVAGDKQRSLERGRGFAATDWRKGRARKTRQGGRLLGYQIETACKVTEWKKSGGDPNARDGRKFSLSTTHLPRGQNAPEEKVPPTKGTKSKPKTAVVDIADVHRTLSSCPRCLVASSHGHFPGPSGCRHKTGKLDPRVVGSPHGMFSRHTHALHGQHERFRTESCNNNNFGRYFQSTFAAWERAKPPRKIPNKSAAA